MTLVKSFHGWANDAFHSTSKSRLGELVQRNSNPFSPNVALRIRKAFEPEAGARPSTMRKKRYGVGSSIQCIMNVVCARMPGETADHADASKSLLPCTK